MKHLPKEDRAGLYITVIVHLAVIIVLLSSGLLKSIKREQSFVLDFTRQEQTEKLAEELAFKQEINRKLNALLEQIGSAPIEPPRNTTVDRAALKDSKGIDADQLYRDAARVQRELQEARKQAAEQDYVPDPGSKPEKAEQAADKPYAGAAVLEWELAGRKPSRLPIPAYKCVSGGEVTVIIGVTPQGRVEKAYVEDATSSPDKRLREEALKAARRTEFNYDSTAPALQGGKIVYSFIAQ